MEISNVYQYILWKKAHDEDVSKRRQLSFLRLYLILIFCPGFRCEAAAVQVFPCEPASVQVSNGSGFSAGGGAMQREALGSPALVFPFTYLFIFTVLHTILRYWFFGKP